MRQDVALCGNGLTKQTIEFYECLNRKNLQTTIL